MPENPTKQSTEEIVTKLLTNTSRQYTESAHSRYSSGIFGYSSDLFSHRWSIIALKIRRNAVKAIMGIVI